MRTIIKTILKGIGIHGPREAREGAEDMGILRQYAGDIALVDFNMMPIDGVEFARMVRCSSDTSNPYLSINMITGHSERSRVFGARDAGVNEFVINPLMARSMLTRMREVVMTPRPYIRCKSSYVPDRRPREFTSFIGSFRPQADGLI